MSETTSPTPTAPDAPAPMGGAPTGAPPGGAQPQQPSGAWYDALPEELRGDGLVKKYPSLPAFVDGFRNAQKLIGAEKLPLPRADAPPEVWEHVYSRLGRPEAPEGYELQRPEGVTITAPEPLEKGYKETAHKLGLNTRQAQELYSWYLQNAQQSNGQFEEGLQAERGEAEAKLRQEWGRAFDQNLAQAQGAMRRLFDQADIESLEARGLGDDPAFVRMLAKVGRAMGEDSVDGKPAAALLSPADAQRRISDIMGDPRHPYRDTRHPAHQQAVNDMAALFEQAYPAT
jgi:hypothetical protein